MSEDVIPYRAPLLPVCPACEADAMFLQPIPAALEDQATMGDTDYEPVCAKCGHRLYSDE